MRTSAPAWASAGARGQHALFDHLIESALLAGSPFDNSGDFRHALAEVAGGCEFLLVDTRRVGTSGGARAESSSAAHDEHLIVEHGRKDAEYRKFLPGGDPHASRKRPSDLVAHLAVSEQVELERPVVEERLDLPRHVGEIHWRPDDDR